MPMLQRIYLVRHGETAWSLSGQHTSRTDIPLTTKGEEDARKLNARLRKLEDNIALFSHGHFGCVLATRWIGLEIEDALHFVLDTASVSILGYGHQRATEPAIMLWNARPDETTGP